MEPETIKAIVALVFAFLLVAFVVLQFKITEPIELEAPEEKLPDESESDKVEHEVGAIVEKNGSKCEVVKSSVGCKFCFLHNENRETSCLEKCTSSERVKYRDDVIFRLIPDESEVMGKDLPVGFIFMKDGEVIEVVELEGCNKCIYESKEECNSLTAPICLGNRESPVIFKKVTDGSEN